MRPLLTRNASRENSSGRIVEARHGDPLLHGGVARAKDDLEDVLQAFLGTLLEGRRDELR
jgi:hypothetical protein